MSLTKRSKRLSIWLSSFIIWIFACSFAVWGIRELLFPATNVCAIERAEGKNLTDISQVYPIKNNIELIGHVGGKAQSVFVRGDTAFVKLGLELAAFDVRNPSNPKRIGYTIIPGRLIHVDGEKGYAYIHSLGDSSGLWKVDVSDPAQMSAIHVYNSKFNIVDIRLSDEQAYITTRKCEYVYIGFGASIKTRCDNTIHIVDTANPDSPIKCHDGILGNFIRTFAPTNTPELINAPKIDRQGKYTYSIEEKEGLEIYDISNPIQPIEVGSYSPSYEFTDVIAQWPYAFVTSAEYQDVDQKTKYALHMFDVTIPADPRDLGEIPYKPVIVTEFNSYAILREQFFYDNWPLGVEILDMSSPKLEGKILAPAQIAEIVNMVVIDDRAYATTNDNRFLILDMSTVENPVAIASYSLGSPDQLNYGVSVMGNYAYIIVRDVGMRVLDISNESNIIEVSTYRMENTPFELMVIDHYAYIGVGSGLEIVDVSNPRLPTQLAGYDAGFAIDNLHILNNYLFMTAGPSGFQIIDVSNPNSPSLVGSFITGTFVTGVDVECPYIYVSDIDNGFFILRSNLTPVDQCG